jgi:hypothetical protein
VLSDLAEHDIETTRFGHLIAATDNDDYNALICTDFGPEFGRGNVLQIGRPDREENRHSLSVTLGGRPLLNDVGGLRTLNARLADGWEFRKTALTEDFDEARLRERLGDDGRLLLARRRTRVLWFTGAEPPALEPDDVVLSFGPGAH